MPQSWVVPFIYLAVILGFCLFSPEHRRSEIRSRLLREPNHYLVTELILILAAIVSTIFSRQHWMTGLAWLLLVCATVLSIRKILTPTGGLEKNGDSGDSHEDPPS